MSVLNLVYCTLFTVLVSSFLSCCLLACLLAYLIDNVASLQGCPGTRSFSLPSSRLTGPIRSRVFLFFVAAFFLCLCLCLFLCLCLCLAIFNISPFYSIPTPTPFSNPVFYSYTSAIAHSVVPGVFHSAFAGQVSDRKVSAFWVP
jgi:hypothetical protein